MEIHWMTRSDINLSNTKLEALNIGLKFITGIHKGNLVDS